MKLFGGDVVQRDGIITFELVPENDYEYFKSLPKLNETISIGYVYIGLFILILIIIKVSIWKKCSRRKENIIDKK